MTFLLAMLGYGNAVVKAVVTWLSHRSLAQLACIALACLAVVQHFTIADARSDAARWQKQYGQIHDQLEAISTAKNQQKAETQERIKVVTRTIREADERAKVIEAAPLPGNCVTPREVRDADI